MSLSGFWVDKKFDAMKSIIDLCFGALIYFYSSNVSKSIGNTCFYDLKYIVYNLSLIHISEPTRRVDGSRMPSSA